MPIKRLEKTRKAYVPEDFKPHFHILCDDGITCAVCGLTIELKPAKVKDSNEKPSSSS